MSMYLDFEPHSWYMGFAIKKGYEPNNDTPRVLWEAFSDNGMTYRIVKFSRYQLKLIKEDIRAYHLEKHTGYGERIAARRLEYLRGELQAERISYGELSELQSLKNYIASDDVELLEAAGVPENV